MDKYYDVESIKELCAEIGAATEAMIYLHNLPPEHKDYHLLLELNKIYEDLSGSMEDFLTHYVYYTSKTLEN